MKCFKEKLEKNRKKFEVFEELLDSIGVKHYGGFTDVDTKAVFVRVHDVGFDTDDLIRSMGLTPSFSTIGLVGKLANNTEDFFLKGPGWVYFRYEKILERL